jgi:hypothetical protein
MRSARRNLLLPPDNPRHVAARDEIPPQRQIPKPYVIHRENLDPAEITAIDGVPVVKLARALRQCAQAHLARDLLEQAARHDRSRGLLNTEEHAALVRELELESVGERA